MKWPLIVRRVVGHSMEPTLREGRIVLASPLLPIGKGDIVVAKVEDREIIKRVSEVTNEGYFLRGDNKTHNRDSHRFGVVKRANVLGRVLFAK